MRRTEWRYIGRQMWPRYRGGSDWMICGVECGGKGEGLIMVRRLELSYRFKNPCSVLLLRIKKLIVEY